MKGPSQKTRVLRALQAVGPAGLTQVDFLAPQVCDEGKPVTRLAARVGELIADGHEITDQGVRNGCKVYRLIGSPWQPIAAPEPPAPEPAPVAPRLVDPPVQESLLAGTPYDPYSEAA